MSDTKSVDNQGVAEALEALKTFNWGTDPLHKSLMAIERAVPAVHDNPEAGKELEKQLAAVLTTDASLAAKDYVFRQLTIIATAQSLPVLASLLENPHLSHRARMVIERMPCDEAAQALRDALPKVSGKLKIGVIGSLGSRRDAASVAALGELVGDGDAATARAAASALGDIGNADAAKALEAAASKASGAAKLRVGDAMLSCAERLLHDGNKAEAAAVYTSLEGIDLPKAVKNAAKRGKLMAT